MNKTMIWFYGDIHGNAEGLLSHLRNADVKPSDMVILLGDVGLNYHENQSLASIKKTQLEETGINFLCIHGNHERRPATIPSYQLIDKYDAKVYAEEKYPHLFFAKDGEIYNLEGYTAIALGGAYSVDKYYRLAAGWSWFADEQPSDDIKSLACKNLVAMEWKVDIVLSHTCPEKFIPIESFMPNVDQSTVDRSTEKWLDKIERRLDYDAWYCGHWHINKRIDRIHFLYDSLECIPERSGE